MHSLRIATRESPLALWQAEFIREELLRHHEALKVDHRNDHKRRPMVNVPLVRLAARRLSKSLSKLCCRIVRISPCTR